MKRLMFIILSAVGLCAFGNGYNDQWQSWVWDESGRTGLYAEPVPSDGGNAAALEARAATPLPSAFAFFASLEARTGDIRSLTVDLSAAWPGFLLIVR